MTQSGLVRLLLCSFLVQLVSAQSKPTYVVSGIVVRHGTNQPLKHAHVTIAQNDQPDRHASLTTGDDGKFTFTNVPEGKYTLAVEFHGATRTFEQDGPFSTGIVTGPSLDSEHIVFSFQPPTSLRLTVLDDESEPVRGARLLLFHRGVSMGWPQISLAAEAATDSQGMGRFAHLEPGTYYVAATGRPWYAQNEPMLQIPESQSESQRELDVTYPVTYYPDAQNPEAASPIQVAEGDSLQLRMTLHAVPAAQILIEDVADNRDSAHREQLAASIEAVGPGGIRFQPGAPLWNSANEHRIIGLAPGSYLVSISHFTPGSERQRHVGTVRVNADGLTKLDLSNISNVSRTSISGQLTLESPLEGNRDASSLKLWLDQPLNVQTAPCRIAHDGAFRCETADAGGNIAPGLYEMRLMNDADLYIKSVAAKGATFSSGLLDVREGASVSLSIVAAKGVIKLNGIALQNGKPVSGAMVLLVPQQPGHDPGIPRDQSDSDGTFTLRDAHPGHYWLLAIDNGHDLEYHNPSVLRPYLGQAQQIVLPMGPDTTVQVSVQKR